MNLTVEERNAFALKTNAERPVNIFPAGFQTAIIRLKIELRIERLIDDKLSVEKLVVLSTIWVIGIGNEIHSVDRIDDHRIARRQSADRIRISIQTNERFREKESARDVRSRRRPPVDSSLPVRIVRVVVAVNSF